MLAKPLPEEDESIDSGSAEGKPLDFDDFALFTTKKRKIEKLYGEDFEMVEDK